MTSIIFIWLALAPDPEAAVWEASMCLDTPRFGNRQRFYFSACEPQEADHEAFCAPYRTRHATGTGRQTLARCLDIVRQNYPNPERYKDGFTTLCDFNEVEQKAECYR